MAKNTVHKTYAELLKWHNKGFALWEPFSSPILTPGSVGFFDSKTRWNCIHEDIRRLALPMTLDFEVVPDTPEAVRDFWSQSLQTLDLHVGGILEYLTLH